VPVLDPKKDGGAMYSEPSLRSRVTSGPGTDSCSTNRTSANESGVGSIEDDGMDHR
jgi:hypothetical protein